MSTLLSSEQREQFIRDGYVVVSGLVPGEIVTSTRDNLCAAFGISLDDPATWPQNERAVSGDTVGLTEPCFTPDVDRAAQELVGDILLPGQCISSILDRQGKNPYVKGFIPVLAYPRAGEKVFDAPLENGGYHVDGIHFSSLWPDKMLLVGLMYLTDTQPYGGATAVIPGSHRRIFEHWITQGREPDHTELFPKLEFNAPVPVAGKAGDMIFMHHLLAHAGSPNRDHHVRVAINANLTSDPQNSYERKSGAPQENWTPLDWTLRTDNI
jgi:ectoine hydroxylase-related dioxygenase (phytanoyl-CoA dioxygenase family)